MTSLPAEKPFLLLFFCFVLVNTNKDCGILWPVSTNSSLVGIRRLLTHHRKKNKAPRWSSVNFKYALSKRLHLSLTIRVKQMSGSVNMILLLLFKT